MDKDAIIADARTEIDHIRWLVPHCTPSIQNESILYKEFSSKSPTGLRYNERSNFVNQVNSQNLSNFKSGSQKSMNVPIRKVIGFQQKNRQDSQDLKKVTFLDYQLLVLNPLIGRKKTPMPAYCLIKMLMFILKVLVKLKKFTELQQKLTSFNQIFLMNISGLETSFDVVGKKLYVFDIRFQDNFTAS